MRRPMVLEGCFVASRKAATEVVTLQLELAGTGMPLSSMVVQQLLAKEEHLFRSQHIRGRTSLTMGNDSIQCCSSQIMVSIDSMHRLKQPT